MQIENYIKDLLFRYDCVIIPDLGAFVVKFESSCINEQSNLLSPPKRTLVFNGQLKSEDVLLMNYISKKENLDFDDARTFLTSYVNDLKKVLLIERSFNFNGLGKLQMTDEDQLIFHPESHQNFHKASFGLSSIRLESIQPKEVEQHHDTPVVSLNEQADDAQSKPWLKYAALLALALLVAGMGYYLIDTTSKEAYQQKISEKVEQEIQKEIQAANFLVSPALPVIEIEVKDEKKNSLQGLNYHIIAGAFRNKENAQSKIKSLSSQGFDAYYLGINKYNLHQVSYSSFATRAEALQALAKIRKSHSSSAWLLVGDFSNTELTEQ